MLIQHHIFIHFTGTKLNFDCEAGDKVHTIETFIRTSLGIPPERQRLFCSSSILQKDKTLYEHGVGDNTSLDLLELISVSVKHGKGIKLLC